MECPDCHAEISATQRYCSQCGAALPATAGQLANPGAAAKLADELARQATDQFKREARLVAAETQETIQVKIMAWAKRQLWLLGVGMALLAFFGIRQAGDFKAGMQSLQNKVAAVAQEAETSVADVKAKTEQFERDFERFRQQAEDVNKALRQEKENLEALRDALRRLNPESAQEELAQMKQSLEAGLAQARQLIVQASAARNDARRLQNSLFKLTIHLDPAATAWSRDRDWIVRTLAESGFTLGGVDVANVSVNTTEIIYYHPEARFQARFIADQLSPRFGTIAQRELFRPERNPRELLIKLVGSGRP